MVCYFFAFLLFWAPLCLVVGANKYFFGALYKISDGVLHSTGDAMSSSTSYCRGVKSWPSLSYTPTWTLTSLSSSSSSCRRVDLDLAPYHRLRLGLRRPRQGCSGRRANLEFAIYDLLHYTPTVDGDILVNGVFSSSRFGLGHPYKHLCPIFRIVR